MSKSEIFDSFVKIAQKEGLLSESDHAEHTEKDFHESHPRHDSLTIEQIGKLYNVKNKMPKDMEYEHNIMEDAHPDPVVLSPAHDKLNGLVENNNERQRIMMRIVHKEPDGHLTQRKYAQKDLVMSLVRLANALDNDGQDELRVLADVCLEQATVKKKLVRPPFGLLSLVELLLRLVYCTFNSIKISTVMVSAWTIKRPSQKLMIY